MNVKVVINCQNTTQDDIRAFVQMIREWELRTPRSNINGVLFETDPEISSAEAKAIFEGVFPEFEHLVEIPNSKAKLLRLGTRLITVEGQPIGTCDELTLSIGEASEEEMQRLQETNCIALVKMNKG